MDTLGEDLVLLSIRPDKGRVATYQRLRYGLMGSELVRLAARGTLDIVSDRIVIRADPLTGDAELDAAVQSMTRSRRPPRARTWVANPRRGIVEAYLARLVASGQLRAERRIVRTSWIIVATDRAASARARLDAVALVDGPVTTEQAALGGLAHASGIDRLLYPGRGNRQVHKRLERIAKGQWTSSAFQGAIADSTSADATSADATSADATRAVMAATDAAMRAASEAAMTAATDAAVRAATDAALQAALAASEDFGAAAPAEVERVAYQNIDFQLGRFAHPPWHGHWQGCDHRSLSGSR